MNAIELFDEISKLGVVELEQRLKQLTGEVAVTRKLLVIARARHKATHRKSSKKQEPAQVS